MSLKIDKLLLFNLIAGHNPNDLSIGSNTWQIKNYEEIASTVYVIFLNAKSEKKITRRDNTIILCLGTGNLALDIFKSPFTLFSFLRRKKINVSITYEQVFLWWILLINRISRKSSFYVLPITLPEKMYEITGKSLSRVLPIWMEKIFRGWSFMSVDNIITSYNLGDYLIWLNKEPYTKNKTIVLDKLIEEVPSPYFFSKLNLIEQDKFKNSSITNLLVIGRLRREKLIDHAILALNELLKKDKNYKLTIIGEGEDKSFFEELTKKLNIEEYVSFEGHKTLLNIVDYYATSDIYVSPFSGSALREVALYGMPIVAYNTDWLKGGLIPDKEFAAVEFLNYKQMAEKIEYVINNPNYATKISEGINKLAKKKWGQEGLLESYKYLLCS